MRQQLARGDLADTGGQIRDVAADGRREIELVLIDERHQCGGDDHLGCRAEAEEHVGGDRSACFGVRRTEGFAVDHIVTTRDGDGDSGCRFRAQGCFKRCEILRAQGPCAEEECERVTVSA